MSYIDIEYIELHRIVYEWTGKIYSNHLVSFAILLNQILSFGSIILRKHLFMS